MSETKAYDGGCHCGAVRYRVTTKLESAVTCNCSICFKTGTMLAFAPAERFELVRGREALTDYQFGRKNIHHLFCNRCGVRSFARGVAPGGGEMVAVNVRCLDGVDVSALRIVEHDGRSSPTE
jgi:hypothetical protein